MNLRAENFYAVWRERGRAVNALHDANGGPPEKLLQAIWSHQRLQRHQLKTADGRPVRVLHPGFSSAEGGPDFRGAVLQIGDAPAVSGDMEIDLVSAGWQAHGHDHNPAFKNVILHVVWENARPNAEVPAVLALNAVLDAPWPELASALENASGLPAAMRGKCSAPLRELNETQLNELLQAAAKVRFENKANAIRARAKNSGWEQALWENLFRALGYKNNTWPMLHLAETKPQWFLRTATKNAAAPARIFEIQARLLGVSGLLPQELTRAQKSSDTFLRRAWDLWWRERDGLESCLLPRTVWKFHGLRPANHPQRRLALAAHWLAKGDLAGKLEDWLAAGFSGGARVRTSRLAGTLAPPKGSQHLLASLHNIFAVECDDFWSWHWTFKSTRLAKPQPLLGEGRVTDLAINVVLPWLWIRAKEGDNAAFQAEIERRFFAWPAAEDNAVLKLARQRLLGAANARRLKTSAAQQGLMQVVRDFCEHSNAICADCRFPELVQCLKSKAQSQPVANLGL